MHSGYFELKSNQNYKRGDKNIREKLSVFLVNLILAKLVDPRNAWIENKPDKQKRGAETSELLETKGKINYVGLCFATSINFR